MIKPFYSNHQYFKIALTLCLGFFFLLPAQAQKGKKKGKKEVSSATIISGKQLFFEGLSEKNKGNVEQAKKLFLSTLEKLPENHAAQYELSRIYVGQGDLDKGITYIEQALEQDPENFFYNSFAAELYKTNGNIKKTITIVEDLAEAYPEKIDLLLYLAALNEEIGNLSNAEKYYLQAEEKAGFSYEIASQRISNYLRFKQYNKALSETERLIEEYPSYNEFRILLIEINLMAGDVGKAKRIAEEILVEDSINGPALIKLANISLHEKRINDSFLYSMKAFSMNEVNIDEKMALMLYYYELSNISSDYQNEIYNLAEIMISVHPNNPKGYSIYGDILRRDLQYEKALKQFKEAVLLAPDKHLIWEEIVLLENQLGLTDSMIVDCERAIEIFPSMPLFYLMQGIGYLQVEKANDAANVLEMGSMMVVDNPAQEEQFYASLGDAYNELKKHKKSDSYYEKALAINPKNAFVLNNYSYYLSLRGENLSRAKEMSKVAISLMPETASFLDTHAWVLYQLKEYEEAKKYLEMAIRFSENGASAEVLEHYGDVLFKLGQKEMAKTQWQKALEKADEKTQLETKISEGL